MRLVYPNEKYLESYTQAYNEYRDNNITTYGLKDPNTEDFFERHYNYRMGINLPEGRVPQTTYWLVENGEFIGEISIRHDLTDFLLKYGGNIGYGVRMTKWRQGYGTKMLKMGLKKAKAMGLSRVLITCNIDNYGSMGVIENNGGVLENIVKNNIDGRTFQTRRYWINL